MVIDETGFLKQGKASCGVARQYTGSAGKITNCQIGVFAAYVSRHGHAFIDRALYLPKEWTDDPDRLEAAYVPPRAGFATKPKFATSMIARDHARCKLWLGRKAGTGRHICGFQTIWIVGPFLRKIQRAIDERMTVARNVGGEDSDLTVRDLTRRTGVLPRHSARCLALLEKAGLVDHEHRILIRQMLDDIIADDIAQTISIPIPPTHDRLLPPRTGLASCLRAQPTRLALVISEQ